MNDIIDPKSGRMEIETHSITMTTKYSSKSSKSVVLGDPVDSTLSYYMRTSSSHNKKCLKTKRDKMLLKKKNLSSKKVQRRTKKRKKRRKETVHK